MRIAAFALSVLVVGGCTQGNWTKPGSSLAQTNMDQSRCQMEAEMGTPIYQSQPTSYTTNYSGSVYSGGSSGYYQGTATTYNNSVDLSGFAIAFKKKAIFDSCMNSLGYSNESWSGRSSPRASPDAYLNAPPNQISSQERASVVRFVNVVKADLPVSVYESSTSASKEIFVIKNEARFEVVAETDGMFKVKVDAGEIGWIARSRANPD